jgi:uncharacterized membrane protein YidH (DUF202 family)
MSSSGLEDDIIAMNVERSMEEGEANGGNSAVAPDAVPESAPLLGATQEPATYDAIEPAPSKKSKKDKDKDKDKDKGKSGQKIVADALKTDMAAERTFFKWLWTGLHVGAIGTFIFVTFDNDKQDPYRFLVVAFSWGIAFGLVLYGLFAYNRRRVALREGRIEILPAVTRDYGPCIVVTAVALVVLAGFAYALFSGAHAKEGSKFAGL